MHCHCQSRTNNQSSCEKYCMTWKFAFFSPLQFHTLAYITVPEPTSAAGRFGSCAAAGLSREERISAHTPTALDNQGKWSTHSHGCSKYNLDPSRGDCELLLVFRKHKWQTINPSNWFLSAYIGYIFKAMFKRKRAGNIMLWWYCHSLDSFNKPAVNRWNCFVDLLQEAHVPCSFLMQRNTCWG